MINLFMIKYIASDLLVAYEIFHFTPLLSPFGQCLGRRCDFAMVNVGKGTGID